MGMIDLWSELCYNKSSNTDSNLNESELRRKATETDPDTDFENNELTESKVVELQSELDTLKQQYNNLLQRMNNESEESENGNS